MRLILSLVTAAILTSGLTACAPVIVGGAASGGLMAADRRSSGAFVDDQTIELKAETKISRELGDKVHVNVTSYNRNVLLTGEAKDEASKAKAEAIAKGVETVSHVNNELAVGFISSISDRANDTYLTSKVKTRMVTENRFPANQVKVVTEASVVYLMGLVSKKEADDAVEITRSTEGVAKVVKMFEYIEK
ncbi:MAG: BON domain-containing protein [Methylophilales bacterium]|nr:BON domain-containing protein [Methylophilales bacterium]